MSFKLALLSSAIADGDLPPPAQVELWFPPASTIDWSTYDGTSDTSEVNFTSKISTTPAPNDDLTSLVRINDLKSVMLYRATDTFLYGRVINHDGSGNVSFGAETLIEASAVYAITASSLNNNLVCFQYQTSTEFKVGIIRITSNSVTLTDTKTLEVIGGKISFAASITPFSFGAGYTDLTDEATTWYCSQENGIITVHQETPFLGLVVTGGALAGVGNDEVIGSAAFEQAPFTPYVYFRGINDGSQLSFPDSQPAPTNAVFSKINASALEGDKAIFVWHDETNSKGQAQVALNTGSPPSLGTIVDFTLNDITSLSVTCPSDSYAVITYTLTNGELRSRVAGVSGLGITLHNEVVHKTGNNNFATSSTVGEGFVIVGFRDDASANEGKTITLVA